VSAQELDALAGSLRSVGVHGTRDARHPTQSEDVELVRGDWRWVRAEIAEANLGVGENLAALRYPQQHLRVEHGVERHEERFGPDSAERLLRPGLAYVVDAIDTVSAKIELVVRAKALGIPIVSAMGAGNKLDPTRFEVADIAQTSVCPLARVMRRELKKRGVDSLTVVYSREPPLVADGTEAPETPGGAPGGSGAARADRGRRSVPGSISFVPPVAGLIAASVVVRDLVADFPKGAHHGRC